MTGATDDGACFREIWSLLRIDTCWDTAVVDRVIMIQLWQRYNNGDGVFLLNTDHRSHQVLLVADDKVLSIADATTYNNIKTC